MIIKRKSLIVAFVSSLIISSVLVLTLVGYSVYTELKGEEFKHSYQELLKKVNAKVYSKHIDVADLDAKIENAGALKGKPVIVGTIKNTGLRHINNILLKIKFLDKDGAMIYEAVLYPQEPALGSASLTQVSIPYLYTPAKVAIKPGAELPFKRILTDCPAEIIEELKKGGGFAKNTGRWSGKFSYEVLAVELQ